MRQERLIYFYPPHLKRSVRFIVWTNILKCNIKFLETYRTRSQWRNDFYVVNRAIEEDKREKGRVMQDVNFFFFFLNSTCFNWPKAIIVKMSNL
jgi:hypothetical protein